jgi:hypothetical protein
MVYEDVSLTMSGDNVYLTTNATIPEPIWAYQEAMHDFWQSGGGNAYDEYPPEMTVGYLTGSCLIGWLDTFQVIKSSDNNDVTLEFNSADTGGVWKQFTFIGSNIGPSGRWRETGDERTYAWCIQLGFPGFRYSQRVMQNMQIRIRHTSGNFNGQIAITGLNFGFADECYYPANPYYYQNSGEIARSCWGYGPGSFGPPPFYGGGNPIAIPVPGVHNRQFSTGPAGTSLARSWAQVVG